MISGLRQKEGGKGVQKASPAVLGNHPGWITLLLSNPRITIISTGGSRYLKTATVCRTGVQKVLLELVPHTNKSRIPKQKTRVSEVVVFRFWEGRSVRKPYPDISLKAGCSQEIYHRRSYTTGDLSRRNGQTYSEPQQANSKYLKIFSYPSFGGLSFVTEESILLCAHLSGGSHSPVNPTGFQVVPSRFSPRIKLLQEQACLL